MPADVLENLKPGHVAPVVAWLCHESCKESGHLYETGAGWSGLLRWETSRGGLFKVDDSFTPSAVRSTFCMLVGLADIYVHCSGRCQIQRDLRFHQPEPPCGQHVP